VITVSEEADMIDTIFNYKGFWGCASKCRIRIYRNGDKDIIIATELPDNPGTSVTNFAEHLAKLVVLKFKLNLCRLVWIEHYPADRLYKENYSRVQFTLSVRDDGGFEFSAPEWSHLTKEEVEKLTGEKEVVYE
jgi:hypothetical protein